MADRYWVGGTANWDATAGTKWATTSGGGGGASVPSASDNAIFDTNSGAVTVTINAAATCLNLECVAGTGGPFAGTLAGSSTLAISGTLAFSAGMTRSYTGAITFNATSGTKTITSNGKTFGGTITFNGVGGTWQLADAFSSSSSLTLTNGTFDFNGKSASMTTFAASGATTRGLTLGASQITLTGTGAVWNVVSTSLTFSSSGSKLIVSDASAAAKTIALGTSLTYSDLTYTGGGTLGVSGTTSVILRDVTVSSTTATSFTITTACTVRTLDFTGFTGTWLATQAAMSLTGAITLASGMTNSATAALTFTDTSGTTRAITSNGKSFGGTITFNGIGGVWQLADAFVSTSTLTLTNGTFDTNAKTVQCTSVSSSNSNTRTLTITNSTITLVPTTTSTIWLLTTTTGLTFNVSGSRIKVAGTAGTTYTISPGTATYNDLEIAGATTAGTTMATTNGSTWRDVLITNASSGTFTSSATFTCRNFNTTGATATFAGASGISLTGNLIVTAGITASFTGGFTFTGTSGTQTITTNGVSFACAFTFNGAGGTFQLQDAFTTTGAITLTAGTFDTNSVAVSIGSLVSNNTNVRGLTLGSSVVTFPAAGTLINIASATAANLTLSAGTSKLRFTNATSSAITLTMAGNTKTWADIEITAGSGALNFSNASLACRDLTISGGSRAIGTNTTSARNLSWLGSTGSWVSGSGPMSLSGNLTLGPACFPFFLGTLTFNGTSGTQIVTSNGKALQCTTVVNAPGAVVQLADTFAGQAFTLTAGTFDTNDQTVSWRGVISDVDNVRSLIIDNSTVTMYDTDPTRIAWLTNHATNLTVSAVGSTIMASGGHWGSAISVVLNDFVWTGGADLAFDTFRAVLRDISFDESLDPVNPYTFTITGDGFGCRDLDMSGATPAVRTISASGQSISVSRNLNVGTLIAFSGALSFAFVGSSGTQTVSGTSDMSGVDLVVDTTGTTIVRLDNTMSFHDLDIPSDFGIGRHVRFKSGATFTVNGQINAEGVDSGHLNTLDTTTPGVTASIVKDNGQVICDYMDVRDLRFGGGALWFLGGHSAFNDNAYGARFTSFYAAPSTAMYLAPTG